MVITRRLARSAQTAPLPHLRTSTWSLTYVYKHMHALPLHPLLLAHLMHTRVFLRLFLPWASPPRPRALSHSCVCSCSQARSFKAFTSLPEQRALVDAAQAEELEQALAAQEAAATHAFLDKLSAAGPEVQAALAPYMRSPALSRVVQTLANDATAAGVDDGVSSLREWALNGHVQALLRSALSALRRGHISEAALEHGLTAALKARN